MIHVFMGNEYGIYLSNARRNALKSKFWPDIDYQRKAVLLNPRRTTASHIPRVGNKLSFVEAARNGYPRNGLFWVEFGSTALAAALSTGSTDYYYPIEGNGDGSTSAASAVWTALGLTAGTFSVVVERIVGFTAAADVAFITPASGAATDADAAGITLAAGSHEFDLGIQFDEGFKVSLSTGGATSKFKVFFRIIEHQAASNL